MCGILFGYESSPIHQDLLTKGKHALKKLEHRGPDEQKLYSSSNWVIGHTRLSIVDLEASHQPMISPNGKQYLSFNGEIYNFQDLRLQLESKWRFSTSGDTEVLLAGLSIYGSSFIKKLEGMWAFIFWDAEKEFLLASRDPLGKKPAYYRFTDGKIFFASELPALKVIDDTRWEEDRESTKYFIKYGFIHPGLTIYKDTFEIKPGHNLEWSPKGGVRQHQYWELTPIRNSRLSFDDARELIRVNIETAVKKRLIADVEIGCFLSGGIDSSIIATLAQDATDSQLSTFTIKFSDKGYDESKFAQMVANRIHSRHREIEVAQPTLETLSELLSNSIGQPFGDSSLLPTFSLCKATSAHVKVALSGDGADEIFSGYQRYQAKVLIAWYQKLPKKLRRSIDTVIARLPDSYAHHSKSLLKKAKEFSRLASSTEFNTAYFAPITLDGLFEDGAPPRSTHNSDSFTTQTSSLEEMMYRDMLVYLPQDILTKVDRASMYSALEVRSPFLDLSLIESAFSLPLSYHRSHMGGKKLLKAIFHDRLPIQITNRRKQGFSSPIYAWFLGSLGDNMPIMNRRINSVLSTNAIENLILLHRSGKRDMSLPLWNILTYLLWKAQE